MLDIYYLCTLSSILDPLSQYNSNFMKLSFIINANENFQATNFQIYFSSLCFGYQVIDFCSLLHYFLSDIFFGYVGLCILINGIDLVSCFLTVLLL